MSKITLHIIPAVIICGIYEYSKMDNPLCLVGILALVYAVIEIVSKYKRSRKKDGKGKITD